MPVSWFIPGSLPFLPYKKNAARAHTGGILKDRLQEPYLSGLEVEISPESQVPECAVTAEGGIIHVDVAGG